jgi:hypothetical protein
MAGHLKPVALAVLHDSLFAILAVTAVRDAVKGDIFGRFVPTHDVMEEFLVPPLTRVKYSSNKKEQHEQNSDNKDDCQCS